MEYTEYCLQTYSIIVVSIALMTLFCFWIHHNDEIEKIAKRIPGSAQVLKCLRLKRVVENNNSQQPVLPVLANLVSSWLQSKWEAGDISKDLWQDVLSLLIPCSRIHCCQIIVSIFIFTFWLSAVISLYQRKRESSSMVKNVLRLTKWSSSVAFARFLAVLR